VQDAGVKEALRFYAKQLKLPTFKDVSEPAAKFRPGQSLEEFVLGLMKREYASRQEKTAATQAEESALSHAQDPGRV
jgi:hypothetical protein